jgi:hypothetical protein
MGGEIRNFAETHPFHFQSDNSTGVGSWQSRGTTLAKPTKTKDDLAGFVARAVADAIGASGVVPPFIEGHIRDGMGRNWDVSLPAPTPVHRKAIDSVRDLYDLE